MAEGIFRDRLGESYDIRSAGLSAPVGRPAHQFAIQVCAEFGIDISRHRATQLDAELLRRNDLVLTMEVGQAKRIVAAHPWASGRIWRMGHPLSLDYPDLLGHPVETFQAFHTYVLQALTAWEPQLRT